MGLKKVYVLTSIVGIGVILASCNNKQNEENVNIEFKNLSIDAPQVKSNLDNTYEYSFESDEYDNSNLSLIEKNFYDKYIKGDEKDLHLLDFEAIKVTSITGDTSGYQYIFEPKTKNAYYYEYMKSKDDKELYYQSETKAILDNEEYKIVSNIELNKYKTLDGTLSKKGRIVSSFDAKECYINGYINNYTYFDSELERLCLNDDIFFNRLTAKTLTISYKDDLSYIHSSLIGEDGESTLIKENGLTTYLNYDILGNKYSIKVEYFDHTLIHKDFDNLNYKTNDSLKIYNNIFWGWDHSEYDYSPAGVFFNIGSNIDHLLPYIK